MDITLSFIKFPLLILVRVICNDKNANSQPSADQDPVQTSLPCFATQTRLFDVWTFSWRVMLNRRVIKKVHEASNFAYHRPDFWLGRNKLSQGKAFLLYYSVFIPPSALAPNPFSIQLNAVYILPHTVVSQREGGWQGAGGGTGGKSYLFLSETTILIQQNNANSAEEALTMQNGWTHHAFFCNRL